MAAMRAQSFLFVWLVAGCASSGTGAAGGADSSASQEQGTVARTLNHLPGVASEGETTPPPAADQDAAPQVEVVPIEGSDLVEGRATMMVEAPISEVRKAVQSFKDYPSFMPHCTGGKVLGRTPDGARDVYLDFEALHGAVKMWARFESPKPVKEDHVEVIRTRFVDGNVKDFRAIWRMRAVDSDTTELSFQIFIHPGIPVPTSLLNEENISGSAKGIIATRAWIESGRGKAD
jgi:ribosome-associated toxin RatA of RatAB toxin-antitoxin module